MVPLLTDTSSAPFDWATVVAALVAAAITLFTWRKSRDVEKRHEKMTRDINAIDGFDKLVERLQEENKHLRELVDDQEDENRDDPK